MNNKQKKGNEPKEIKASRSIDNLMEELNYLKALKEVFETKSGNMVLRSILQVTNPATDPAKEGGGKIGYVLGVQSVGRYLLKELTKAGCDLKMTDFVSGLDTERVNIINAELSKLLKEKKSNG